MKSKMIRLLLICGFIFTTAVFYTSSAQDPSADPPPPPSGGLNGNQGVPGGGAPIGEGILLLTALGAAYGGKKWYFTKKQLEA